MRKTLGILVGLLFVSLVQVAAQTTSPNPKKSLDKVVAVIGSSIILQSEIDMQYAQYLSQGNPDNADVRCEILQGLISRIRYMP